MMDTRNTVFELGEAGPKMAILSLGSTEQHSRHLPLCTDTLLSDVFCAEIGRQLGAYVLPTVPITNAMEHQGRPGSVTVPPQVLADYVEAIVENLIEQGFRDVVIFIGHGGIFSIQPLLRVLNRRHAPRARIVRVAYEQMHDAAQATGVIETDELHSGEQETSLMLYAAPELVHMERAVDCQPTVGRDALNYQGIWHISPQGAWGEPTKATAEKGQIVFEAMAGAAVEYIRETLAMMGENGYTR